MTSFNDPWQPSGRYTWPDSPSDIEQNYMRLPGKRKMIKIRQTIYEAPGNPFQDELDAERRARGEEVSALNRPLPNGQGDLSPTGRSFFELDVSDDPVSRSSEIDGSAEQRLSLDSSLLYEPSEISPTATSSRFDSVDKGSNYGPELEDRPRGPQRTITEPASVRSLPQQIRREHHRSMSLAIPVSPPPDGEEYVSPRRFWRRENSLPLMKEGFPGEAAAPKSARDTRFYGFYEDLMRDYDKRRSKL